MATDEEWAAFRESRPNAEFPKVGRSPRFDLNSVSGEELQAEREHRGPRDEGPGLGHYDMCESTWCPCYREGRAFKTEVAFDTWFALWQIMQECEGYRAGETSYDIKLDHIYELAAGVIRGAYTAATDTGAQSPESA